MVEKGNFFEVNFGGIDLPGVFERGAGGGSIRKKLVDVALNAQTRPLAERLVSVSNIEPDRRGLTTHYLENLFKLYRYLDRHFRNGPKYYENHDWYFARMAVESGMAPSSLSIRMMELRDIEFDYSTWPHGNPFFPIESAPNDSPEINRAGHNLFPQLTADLVILDAFGSGNCSEAAVKYLSKRWQNSNSAWLHLQSYLTISEIVVRTGLTKSQIEILLRKLYPNGAWREYTHRRTTNGYTGRSLPLWLVRKIIKENQKENQEG